MWSLNAVSIPLAAIDIRGWGGADYHSHLNDLILPFNFLTSRINDAFDIFVINADLVPRLFDPESGISRIPLSGYRIGIWHWETSSLPAEHAIMGGYFNEIWVPSQYIKDAIISTAAFPISNVKVFVIPYAYESLPELDSLFSKICARRALSSFLEMKQGKSEIIINYPQQYYSLSNSLWPQESLFTWFGNFRFLFLIIFDFNSDIDRKNIISTITSFNLAFGRKDNVGLVIKSINALHHDNDKLSLLHKISNIPNVLYISGVFQSSELKKLKVSCDCFVSLHRSEGWGLNILDSVLSGKPVIASAFGGSEQYMLPLYEKHNLNELRIPISIVNVTKTFGPYSTDMFWAEPSIEAAVYAMRQLYLKPNYYASRAAAVRSDAINILSPEETGLKMKRRLDDIYQCLCSLRPAVDLWQSSCFSAVRVLNSLNNNSVCEFGIEIGRSSIQGDTIRSLI